MSKGFRPPATGGKHSNRHVKKALVLGVVGDERMYAREIKRRLEALGCRVHSVNSLANYIHHNVSELRHEKGKNKSLIYHR